MSAGEEKTNGGDEDDELSPEESEGEDATQENVTKHDSIQNQENLPRKVNNVPKGKNSKVKSDHKDSPGIHFQDTSIVESAKVDYSGTQAQTIRFDQDEVNDQPKNVTKENDGDDRENHKNSSKEVKRTSRRVGNLSHSAAAVGKKVSAGKLRRERTSEPTGPKEHEEIREKIRLAGMAVVAHGKLDGPTSAACAIL